MREPLRAGNGTCEIKIEARARAKNGNEVVGPKSELPLPDANVLLLEKKDLSVPLVRHSIMQIQEKNCNGDEWRGDKSIIRCFSLLVSRQWNSGPPISRLNV